MGKEQEVKKEPPISSIVLAIFPISGVRCVVWPFHHRHNGWHTTDGHTEPFSWDEVRCADAPKEQRPKIVVVYQP